MSEVPTQVKPTERESLLKSGSFNEFGIATDFKTKVKSVINYLKAYKYFVGEISKQGKIVHSEVYGSMKKAFSLNALSLFRQTEDNPRLGIYPKEVDLIEAGELNVKKDIKSKRKYPSDIDLHIGVHSNSDVPGALIILGSKANTYKRFGVYIQTS